MSLTSSRAFGDHGFSLIRRGIPLRMKRRMRDHVGV
jgi:hypothetical protein